MNLPTTRLNDVHSLCNQDANDFIEADLDKLESVLDATALEAWNRDLVRPMLGQIIARAYSRGYDAGFANQKSRRIIL